MSKRKMSLPDALTFVPDDLPDGAYWAMAHEIAGAEYGEVWEELPEHPQHRPFNYKQHKCKVCKRRFGTDSALAQHTRDSHKAKP